MTSMKMRSYVSIDDQKQIKMSVPWWKMRYFYMITCKSYTSFMINMISCKYYLKNVFFYQKNFLCLNHLHCARRQEFYMDLSFVNLPGVFFMVLIFFLDKIFI